MAIGGNQSLGLRAKVEAAVDRQSQRKITKDVESAIGKAEDVSPGGFRDRTSPSGGGGGGGLGTAGGFAAGRASGAASKVGGALGGGAALGGAAILGTVALGGALANRMLGAMTAASGEMKATASILGTATDLFFKPFGDFLGRTLRPMSMALLEMAVGLNKNISEDGLIIGGMKSLVDFVKNLPTGLANVLTRTMGQQLEGLFGENEFFTQLQNFDWNDFLTPLESWALFINPLSWTDWVSGIRWRTFIDPLPWSTFVGDLPWSNFVDPPNWNAILPSISADEFIDAVISRARGGGGGGSGGGGGGGGGINLPDPDLNLFAPGNQDLRDFSIELDGRRLGELSRSEQNHRFRRVFG